MSADGWYMCMIGGADCCARVVTTSGLRSSDYGTHSLQRRKAAFVDCPMGRDVFAQLSEVRRFPANRIGVDEVRKMVVEPSDNTVKL